MPICIALKIKFYQTWFEKSSKFQYFQTVPVTRRLESESPMTRRLESESLHISQRTSEQFNDGSVQNAKKRATEASVLDDIIREIWAEPDDNGNETVENLGENERDTSVPMSSASTHRNTNSGLAVSDENLRRMREQQLERNKTNSRSNRFNSNRKTFAPPCRRNVRESSPIQQVSHVNQFFNDDGNEDDDDDGRSIRDEDQDIAVRSNKRDRSNLRNVSYNQSFILTVVLIVKVRVFRVSCSQSLHFSIFSLS